MIKPVERAHDHAPAPRLAEREAAEPSTSAPDGRALAHEGPKAAHEFQEVSVLGPGEQTGELHQSEPRDIDPAAKRAVSVASRGAGGALPVQARNDMERSLGTDMSQVRIHTDAAAAEAAGELGARAFTIGNHVYFGLGQFSPTSGGGRRLLAHELTHVAQHRRADTAPPPTRVSSPLDPAERGARRAAETVAQGGKTSVPGSTRLEPGVIHRDQLGMTVVAEKKGKYNEAVALQEQAAQTEALDQEMGMSVSVGANMKVVEMTNVMDTQMAEAEMKKIRDAEPKLVEGIKKRVGGLSGDKLSDNHNSLNVLGQYLAVAGIQTTSMSNFQQQYTKLMQDYDRLDSMVAMLEVGAGSGAGVGKNVVESQHLNQKDRMRMSADVDSPDKNAAGPMSTKKAELREAKQVMTNASRGMKGKEREIAEKSYLLQAQINNIAGGLPVREKPKEVEELNELKEKLEKLKGVAKSITGFATKALGGYVGSAAGAIATSVAGKVQGEGGEDKAKEVGGKVEEKAGEKATDLLSSFAEFLITLPWAGDLAVAEAKAKAALGDQKFALQQEQWNTLDAKKIALEVAVQNYLQIGMQLEDGKKRVRDVTIELGRTADSSFGGKEHKWEVLATFLGECDAYLAQSTATMGVGQNEQQQAVKTTEARSKINYTKEHIQWWSARLEKNVSNDNHYWAADKHAVRLPQGKGSAETDKYLERAGANDIMDAEMERLKVYHKEMQAMRDQIGAQFTARAK
jgi:hypothetical protein